MEISILKKAANELKKTISTPPRIAVVLGSGLGAWADSLSDREEVSYDRIPGLPVSTVEGHCGKFVFGVRNGVRILAMQGRVHYYEGYSSAEVVRPVRLAAMLGAQTVILTNAAGGITVPAGEIMMIRDQICLVPSPLIGPNISELGTRFPDMSAIYDAELRAKIRHLRPDLREGVYLQTSGPQYETPAEIALYRSLGADAVGMSTAVEAVAAKHAGLRVLGFSLITNGAAGSEPTPLSHKDVQTAAKRAETAFSDLLDLAVSLAANK